MNKERLKRIRFTFEDACIETKSAGFFDIRALYITSDPKKKTVSFSFKGEFCGDDYSYVVSLEEWNFKHFVSALEAMEKDHLEFKPIGDEVFTLWLTSADKVNLLGKLWAIDIFNEEQS